MDKIKCLLVNPSELPIEIETSQELEDLQNLVDGYIECISLDDETILICNEEGKIRGLPYNRKVPGDIIVGTFIIVGDDFNNACFKSLTEEQITKYKEMFGEKSIVLPYPQNVKFLVTGIKSNEEKQKLEEIGLYCYDLRDSDDGMDIGTIEKRVVVNRIGTMITNKDLKIDDYLDYNTFVNQNIQVDIIKELLESTRNKDREKER